MLCSNDNYSSLFLDTLFSIDPRLNILKHPVDLNGLKLMYLCIHVCRLSTYILYFLLESRNIKVGNCLHRVRHNTDTFRFIIQTFRLLNQTLFYSDRLVLLKILSCYNKNLLFIQDIFRLFKYFFRSYILFIYLFVL